MAGPEAQLPLTEVAFDDPETRDAWERTRRSVSRRLWFRSLLWSAALVLGLAVSSLTSDEAKPVSSIGPLVFTVGMFGLLFSLYTCRGALSRVRRARSVLEACPWQALPAVRRITGGGVREGTGVVVQFRSPHTARTTDDAEGWYSDEHGTWSPTMSARNPLRWNRWDAELEKGAWFAGDLQLGGVLARPGGQGLMTVQRRAHVLHSERTSAERDHRSVVASARRG
ncbi:hypothetical protein ACFPA8_08420 [Streptomyces ovatisporus]|uniref:Uncharacterized protein n=1 Tax=Streptomyces ovatisporus TaxID=1128682 RepID=A0ABV9A4L6_9ACTN